MTELPPGIVEAAADSPLAPELAALERAQSLHRRADAKLRALTRDFRAQRFYAPRTELRALALRVYHTFEPPVAARDESGEGATPGRWTLHVEATDPRLGDAPVNLVHYFRKVSIELDPRLYSDSMVEWTCFQKGNHDVHALEVARAGQTPHSVRIKLQPSHVVERFALSDELRAAVGADDPTQTFAKQDVLVAVWEYIKRRNLIKDDDCRVAVCDATLRQLFQCDTLPFTSIVVALKPHLTPAPTLDVEYELSLAGAGDDRINEQVVRVDVGHVDEVARARATALHAWEELQQEQHKELELLAHQETLLRAQLDACLHKHAWLGQLARDPAGFVADVVASQDRDMQLLTSEAETDEINVPHPHQFTQPWVREIVAELLVPPPTN